jgi:hypothetical protein
MPVLLMIATATLLVLAGPAFADCTQEVQSLKQAVIQAETGATTSNTGLPATEHQKEVLSGRKAKHGETTGVSGSGQTAAPISPHQQQVLKEAQGNNQQPAELLAKAGDLANTGDEQGCMQKVAQVKSLLGIH